MTKDDRWAKVSRVYHSAMAREPSERLAYLREACANDGALLVAVKTLLDCQADAEQFLASPVVELLPNLVDRDDRSSDVDRPTISGAAEASADAGVDTSAAAFDVRIADLSPLDDARFPPGHLFASRYRIVSLLGRGAMGEVYRAEDLKLGQSVAVKLISADLAAERASVTRFVREVRLARGIAHPNVCRVYDIGESEGWHYLSMEYVDGETLASLLQRIGRLPYEKALDIARQLCAGLAAAHERGILHRDLKPSNIMVDGRGRVRIMDFGIAVPVHESGIRELAGTPAYMAPEQSRLLARLTERSDLYALGLVLYELFSGHQLLTAEKLRDRERAAADAPAAALLLDVEPRVAHVIAACVAPIPAQRPATALHVAAALPGGDPVAAALAEGRILTPDMVAAASMSSALRPAIAWTLLVAVVVLALVAAAHVHVLTLPPSALPKPPAVLADRAREILQRVGVREGTDSAHWLAVDPGDPSRGARFVYRQSPRSLVPSNMFHVVTEADPPHDVPGMATLEVDASGRLTKLSRVSASAPAVSSEGDADDWATLFEAAGLDEQGFVRVAPDVVPLLPHDERITWEPRETHSPRQRVTGALLGGRTVYFAVDDRARPITSTRVVDTTGRSPAAESVFWGVVACWLRRRSCWRDETCVAVRATVRARGRSLRSICAPHS